MIIKSENPELEYKNEYDLFNDVYYKGIPYTGKILSSNPKEETTYRNGKANGDSMVYYKDGTLREHEIYNDGKFVRGTGFYPNSSKMKENSEKGFCYWNLEGTIVSKLEFGKQYAYYSTGQMKSFSDKENNELWQTKYYSKSGEILFTLMKDQYINGTIDRKVEYNDMLMEDNYFELVAFENAELKNESINYIESNRIHHVWMWFWKVLDKDPRKYFQIVNQLIKHEDKDVLNTIANIVALHKFHKYIEQKNFENEKAYELINSRTEYHDDRDPNRSVKTVEL